MYETEKALIEEYLETKLRLPKTREDYRKTIVEFNAVLYDKLGEDDAFCHAQKKEVDTYVDWLNEENANGKLKYSTIRKKLSILTSITEYLEKSTDLSSKYLGQYISKYRNGEEKVSPLNIEEIDRLYGVIDSDIDRLLFLLMYKLGLKTTDLAGIGPGSFIRYKDTDVLCYRLQRKRKGQLHTEFIELTDDMLELIPKLPVKDGHYITPDRWKKITSSYISMKMKRYGILAGLDHVTSMRIRRSGASLLYTLGGDEEDIAQHLGITRRWVQDYQKTVASTNIRETKLKHIEFKE